MVSCSRSRLMRSTMRSWCSLEQERNQSVHSATEPRLSAGQGCSGISRALHAGWQERSRTGALLSTASISSLSWTGQIGGLFMRALSVVLGVR